MGYHEIVALVMCIGSVITLAIGLIVEARRSTNNNPPH